MKVLQLVNSRRLRGAEIFAAQLSEELVLLGASVHYAGLYKTEGQVLSPAGVAIIDFQRRKSRFPDLVLLYRLCRLVSTIRPDIVQANAGDTLKYAVFARVLTGSSFNIIFRNASLISRYLRGNINRQFTKFLLFRTSSIVSVSEASLKDTVNLFPALQGRISKIPVGIPVRSMKVTDLPDRTTGRFLIHVGGFSFEKNHEGLIRIFMLIREQLPEVKLWLAGDGPLRERVEQQVEMAGLRSSVTFLGSVANPLDYIHAAEVMLLPSIIEGIPAVILEAFWCQTPVVASNVGGIPEVIQNEFTGWMEDPSDEQRFAACVLEVLKNHQHRKQVAAAAYTYVLANHDNSVIAKKFFDRYARQMNTPEA